MSIPHSPDELLELLLTKGQGHYGEGVTQLEHALQCAHLARRAGARDELVAAALLHDIGHLVADLHDSAAVDLSLDDDVHEAVGAQVLAPVLGPGVAQPVALHVVAKRWRCTVDPAYLARLSPASRASLNAQGGPLDESARLRFEAHPGFGDAIALRDWDDGAKVPGLSPGDLEDYRELLTRLSGAR